MKAKEKSERGMKSLLAITTLDYQQEANQRIHHVVERFSLSMEKVTVIHFHLCDRRSLKQWIKNSFPFSVKEYRKGKISFLCVNPLGNFPENFGKGLLRFPESKSSKTLSFGAISRLLNLLGLCKSLSTTLSYLLAYLLKLRRETFDVVLVEGPWEGLVGSLVKAMGRAQVMVYQDIDYIPGDLSSRIRKRITELLEFYCMSRADLRISCGRLLQEFRQRRLGKEVLFIPNGVNYRQLKKAQKKVTHKPTLIYMGNVIDWSGLHWAIKVLPSLLREISDLKLMIAGRGNPQYIGRLKDLVRSLCLENATEFIGFVPYHKLPFFLNKADIGLAIFEPIPLRRYAFPLKVVEYMCAGLPVIASKHTESARIIDEYQCGITVTYGENYQLKEAVIRLIKHYQRFKVFVENAIKGSEQLSWERLMEVQFKHITALFR